MKLLLFSLLITLLFINHIGAQRARTPSSETSDAATRTRGRGRVKFTVPSDISETDLAEAAAPVERRTETARKVDRKVTKVVRPSNKPYEVKEVLDDIPNTNVRKIHKPRVITETRFEAANAPKKPLYLPLPLPEEEILPEDLLVNFSAQTARATTEKAQETVIKETTIPLETSSQSASTQDDVSTEELLPITTNLGRSSELTTLSEPSSTENEIKKIDSTTPEVKKKLSEPVQIVTPLSDLKKATRLQARPRVPNAVSTTEEVITVKTRTRVRPVRKQEVDSSETASSSYTSSRTRTRVRQEGKNDEIQSTARPLRTKAVRRRLDIADVTEAGVRGRVPSLFSAENTQEVPSRARTGRKVNYPSGSANENVQSGDRRLSFRRRSPHVKDRSTSSIEPDTTTSAEELQSIKDVPRNSRRGSSRNYSRNNKARASDTQNPEQKTTVAPSTNRRPLGRSRKVEKRVEKNLEATESSKVEKLIENAGKEEVFTSKPARGRSIDVTRIEKQVVNTNKNEVIFPPKSARGRSYTTEKAEIIEETNEALKSKNKPKQTENEITTTTTSSTVIPSSTVKNYRRAEYQSRNKPEVQSESKVQERLASSTQSVAAGENRRNTARNRIDTRRNKPVQQESKTIPEVTSTRNDNRRRNSSRKSNSVEPQIKETSTEARETFRSRSRTRFIPPIIDEQKLEVLPLFESEAKTVAPIRRRPNVAKENLNVASTSEHQVKVGNNNEILSDSPRVHTKSEQIQLGRNGEPIIKESVETKVSEVVTKRKIGRHVLRKVKVNKPNNNNLSDDSGKSNETNENEQKVVKVTANDRGHKRVEFSKDKNKNLSSLTSSEEQIGDSDNYPEPFKALIQAKLSKKSNNKGSRSQQKPSSNEDTITKSTERIVTSSRTVPITASTYTTTTSIKTTTTNTPAAQTTSSKANNDENELVPNTSTTPNARPTRRRFSLTTKHPETEDASGRYTKRPSFSVRKVTRSTVVPSHVSVITEVSAKTKKQSRYHARFSATSQEDKSGEKNLVKSSEKEVEIVTSTPKSRSFSPKPPRGLYSTRNGNNKKRTGKLDSPLPPQQVGNGAKKANRFSARYRSDLFSRSGSTRPTHAPAYIPTVPTVTPPSVKSGVEDIISGMEVISIDDPVNTIQSDSLINGELLSPSNPYNPSSKLVPASLVTRNQVTKDGGSTTASPLLKPTEKPVSIIERIIYSITAISTASPDVAIDLTNDGPTKASAILKIPSKTNKEDLTFDINAQQQQRQQTVTNEIKPLTTEKPTTIIERILSSISAIQASSTEGTDTQVGNNLNTISTTFKPLLSKSVSSTLSTTVSTTLSPSSTPQDALDVIEQISSEQSLQQRTISKLLALLKTITPDTQSAEKVVVVTPKVTSFTSAISEGSTINREVEVFNASSNFVSETPESQGEFLVNDITTTNPTESSVESAASPDAMDSENAIENRFGITTQPSNEIENNDVITSATPNVVTSNPNSLENQSTQDVGVTTPDLLQNTIAQNTAGTESVVTNAPTTADTNLAISLNSRLPDTISISDFLATLDTLNSIEPTTPSSSITTTIANTLTTGSQNNENIESTTPSLTNESATPGNSLTTTHSAESTVSNEIISTTVESASLVVSSSAPSGTPETPTTIAPISAASSESTTTLNDKANLISASDTSFTTIASSDVMSTTAGLVLETNTQSDIPGNFIASDAVFTTVTASDVVSTSAGSVLETNMQSDTSGNSIVTSDIIPTTTENAPASDDNTTPSISARFEFGTDAEIIDTTTITPQIIEDTTTPSDSNQPVVTTEIPSTTPMSSELNLSTSAGDTENIDLTTVSPESSSISSDPSTMNPTIMAMLTRLLEIAGRAQSLTSLSLEQTTVSTVDSSTTQQPSTIADITNTIPPLSTVSNFEVSPGSVTIFSANDISSMFNLTDDGTTVTISSRSFLTTSPSTTEMITTPETTSKSLSSTGTNTVTAPTTNAPADSSPVSSPDTSAALMSTTISPSDNFITTSLSPDVSADIVGSTIAPSDNSADVMATTTLSSLANPVGDIDSTTTEVVTMTETSTEPMLPATDATTLEVTTTLNNNNESSMMDVSNETLSNVTNTISDRSGRLLAIEPDPVRNEIQISSESPAKDYFIFGILPNNTIVRKRPNKYPNKDTPFVIVGVYPNNTVIQKFPNGTLIPKEPVIQVSGFDTRENPPILPEITSNQVTQEQDSSPPNDNQNLQTGGAFQNSITVNQRVAAAEPVVTTNAPPTATLAAIADTSNGTPASEAQTVAPQVGNKNRDVEEVNIEENTISNKGNTRPEKIVELTTPPTTGRTLAPTTAPIQSDSIVTTTPEAPTPVPTIPTVPMTTLLAAIRIDDLTDGEETTIPVMETTTNMPNVENRIANTEVITTTTERELTTQRFFAARYTNTPSTVTRQFENLQLTITPTTPYLIQRIIGNITGVPVRLGGETTSMLPVSTVTTEVPTTEELPTTTPTTTIRARPMVRITTPEAITAPIITTTPIIATTEVPVTTPQSTTNTPLPTTTFINRMRTTTEVPSTTTFRSRGRNRFSATTPYDSFQRTVTVTPSTIFTDYPISTTFIPRRYTQTPTTINVPSRIASFTPNTDFSNIPTITEQNFPQTTPQTSPVDISTLFPVYTTTFEGTTATPMEVTQQPSPADTTTNTPPTFAATQRPRQRTTTPLQRLAELRVTQNYGEMSTTSDYFSSTTPEIPSSTSPTTLQTTLKTINTKVRQLTEQQKRDLEELTRLEKEQQAILQQLAFLTRLNLAASPKPTRSPNNLAGRVLDFAAERNKETATQSSASLNLLEALTRGTSKPIQDKNPSVEDVLKQLNSATVSSLSSPYGKSTDALLAALLKEQGIEPNTPKSLGDQLKTTTPFIPTTITPRRTTTRRRTTTTPRPGPIMQGLNWLLNALAPQPTTTRKPTPKKATTTTSRINLIPQDVEIISSQPTEISPVIVTAPPRMRSTAKPARQSSRSRKPLHSLSEEELQNLINQLEVAQKDPSKVRDIDFASLGFTQTTPKSTTLLDDNAVQITNSGKVGSSSKLRLVSDSSATEAEIVPLVYNRGKATTAIPSRVSNSIIDDVREETTTMRPRRTTLPPLQLNPVRGIDDGGGETQVRGQLINAAVNVTRAISQFLGSAIQGAAQSFQSFIGSGSRQVGNYFSTSSISSNNNRPG